MSRPPPLRRKLDPEAGDVHREIGMRHRSTGGEIVRVVGKDRRRAKVLFWDGTGLCGLAKRPEKGKFAAPWAKKKALVEWTTSELALFLEGSELVGRVALSPPAWTRAEQRVVFR